MNILNLPATIATHKKFKPYHSYLKTITYFLLIIASYSLNAQSVVSKVDYKSFLSQHDMVWEELPNKWQLAPFSGNGNVGFLFYQRKGDAKNTIALHVGRHDYYDHRDAPKKKQLLWINRGRLPLGHFKFTSKGEITKVEMRLSLWDAKLTGTIHTSEGAYHILGITHSTSDAIYFETEAQGKEAIQITWHPDDPISPVWETLQAGGGPRKGGSWQSMINDPLPKAPKYTISEEAGINYCYQPLYQERGETTTAWTINGEATAKQALLVSIHHSYPEHTTMETVKKNILQAEKALTNTTFFSSHEQWWHEYYPLSFLTLNDAEKEAFYWIQMYKFASATRQNGPIMDLMGPWYNRTFWPMVWGDLNVQLQYWTHLTCLLYTSPSPRDRG